MVITYNGENYFKISSGDYSILVDPSNQRSYKGASAIIFTEKNIASETNESADTFLVDHAGEFEVGGISITGFQVEGDSKNLKTIYRIVFDDIIIAILGKISVEPTSDFTEYLEGADIVIAPIGGKPYASISSISKFIRQIEPGIIIPALYSSDKQLKEFYKEFGSESKTCDEKLVLKKKDIEEKAMEIRCLKSE